MKTTEKVDFPWAAGPLVDWQLISVGPEIFEPFDPKLINQATVNLPFGKRVIVEAGDIMKNPDRFKRFERQFLPDGLVELDISSATQQEPLYVAPRQWLLGEVAGSIRIPKNCDAKGYLRSSAARRGWQHATALYVDAGYHGKLTVELFNYRGFKSLPLYPGIELIQIQINLLANTPNSSYSETGRYAGDQKVNACQDRTI